MPPKKLRKIDSSAAETTASEPIEAPSLPPRDEQPARTFILPQDLSPEAKIVMLKNPSNGKPSRYLYCPKTGFYEFTQVGSTGSNQQSCMLVPQSGDESENTQGAADKTEDFVGNGYVVGDAQLLVATPFDIKLFFMPLVKPGLFDNKAGRPHRALMTDNLFKDLGWGSKHMEMLLRHPSVRKMFESQLPSIFEVIECMGDTMYRPDSNLMCGLIVQKAKMLVAHAWPASLEKYVQKRLEVPIAVTIMRNAKRTENSQRDGAVDTAGSGDPAEGQDTESQPSANTVVAEEEESKPTDNVVQQLRLRTAIDFVMASYVTPELKKYFASILDSPNQEALDFKEMRAYLKQVEKMKKEVQALRSISDNVTRKRPAEEDDEIQEAKAEKKRRKEEEERKQKQESRATKDLKKVDTSGMKKMSSFFTKKPAA